MLHDLDRGLRRPGLKMQYRRPIALRPARVAEASRLSELAMRSKAHWGYPADFVEACRNELTYTPATIADPASTFVVAEQDGGIVGFHAIRRVDPTTFELEALFVEPASIGSGVGRRLLDDACGRASRAGGDRLVIQGDPHATGFYRACGAVETGSRASASIPGRFLPVFTLSLHRDRAR